MIILSNLIVYLFTVKNKNPNSKLIMYIIELMQILFIINNLLFRLKLLFILLIKLVRLHILFSWNYFFLNCFFLIYFYYLNFLKEFGKLTAN